MLHVSHRILLVVAVFAIGCGDATGTVRVSASGEQAAVQGFPVGDVGFVDGWTLRFQTLVVSVRELGLHGRDGERAVLGVDDVLVDLTQGEQVLFEIEAVGARRWEDVRYAVAPATADSVDVGVVDPSVRQRMIEEGWSIYLEATAEKDGLTRTLAWGFEMDVLNTACLGQDGTSGLVVASGAITEAQVTLHWDHLFFDSLRLDEGQMRFDAMSAVAEPDGSVTFEGLNTQRLADLRDADGEPLLDADGEPVFYDPGSNALTEPTLRYHTLASTRTIGHFNGEGHCEYTER